jgi:hypothetical protein
LPRVGGPCRQQSKTQGPFIWERSVKFIRGAAAFAGPKLLRLLEREGFRHATCDGVPPFSGKRLAIAYLRW